MNARLSFSPPSSRGSPLAVDTASTTGQLDALWRAYREGRTLRCACGRGGLALSVLTSPRAYCFQCMACAWQTGWFRSGDP